MQDRVFDIEDTGEAFGTPLLCALVDSDSLIELVTWCRPSIDGSCRGGHEFR